ncbi:MAG TPA: enoyl-CoA hydratase/isomerase family protein [Caulobacteraceae bacterium]|nr:enoyl-CoA hydratase/isomerase family protein [Caulobacteraceae bacterium]
MALLSEYRDKFRNIELRREDGILEVRLHTKGNDLLWSRFPDKEVGDCFGEIARDSENRCVILTGTGETFCTGADPEGSFGLITDPTQRLTAFHDLYEQGYRLHINHLDIPVPVIAAVNGPATWHAEVPLLSDIVICTDDTYFQDAPHFPTNLVPGDGVHVVWPAILGPNLGRYFLLTGMKLGALEALQRGVVQEIHARADLLPRAWSLARDITRHPDSVLRATRAVMVQKLRREMVEMLPNGLSKELVAALFGMASGTIPTRQGPEDISLRR